MVWIVRLVNDREIVLAHLSLYVYQVAINPWLILKEDEKILLIKIYTIN